MTDVFDNIILCKKCNKAMKFGIIEKNGFELRAVQCSKCKELIVHPVDKQEYKDFIDLKKKEFNVKMRMVGNSYAVSIPRQIVDFMKEQEKAMNDMVRLCFEDAHRLSLRFGENEDDEGGKGRTIRSKEIRVVSNGKPVLHVRKHFDSADPRKNVNKVFKARDSTNKIKDKEKVKDLEREGDC